MIVSDDEDTGLCVYKAVGSSMPESMIGTIPCGSCPVFDFCAERGPVTPSNCEYFDQWLTF